MLHLPKAKYDMIYHDLKQKIEDETYPYQELLPSEHILVKTYGCSRNTVRRALAELTSDGYVQPMHGKGARNIFQPVEQAGQVPGRLPAGALLGHGAQGGGQGEALRGLGQV